MEKYNHKYGAEQIQVLEGLEAVRKRPGMYIGSTSVRGLHHLVYEIVDNCVDEAMAGYCTEINVIIEPGNVISVEDNGIGIPKDKINEIFNRFYQVSDTLKKHEEGSGIGLCIVEEIVNLHGGKINVYSEVNKGTKFEIILPIYTVEKNFKNLQIKDIQQIVKLEMSEVDTKEN